MPINFKTWGWVIPITATCGKNDPVQWNDGWTGEKETGRLGVWRSEWVCKRGR